MGVFHHKLTQLKYLRELIAHTVFQMFCFHLSYLATMQLKQMLPLNTNIRLAYSNGKDDEQNFIQNLSLFLCTFLKGAWSTYRKKIKSERNINGGSSLYVIGIRSRRN